MKHLKIALLTVAIGTLLGPLLCATWIGMMSGKPLIVFYPGTFAVAYILGGPIAFGCSLVAVWLGTRMVRSNVMPPSMVSWLKRFGVAGGIVGAVAFSLAALGFEAGSVSGILSDLTYKVPNGFVDGLLCGVVLAIVWYRYAQALQGASKKATATSSMLPML